MKNDKECEFVAVVEPGFTLRLQLLISLGTDEVYLRRKYARKHDIQEVLKILKSYLVLWNLLTIWVFFFIILNLVVSEGFGP